MLIIFATASSSHQSAHHKQRSLERRGCTRASQCTSSLIANQIHTCTNHGCHKACKTGYAALNGKCAKTSSSQSSSKAVVAVTTASTSAQSTLEAQGITGFLGSNGPGIASWYHTDSTTDSTNGHSWCGYPYDDSLPGFAPDVSIMLANFGNSWTEAGKAYCGLEAEFTTPDGLTTLLYIADGFDPAWVRTPGSVDVIYNSWPKLSGYTTTNKDNVVQGVTWKFTGKRNSAYSFEGAGSGR